MNTLIEHLNFKDQFRARVAKARGDKVEFIVTYLAQKDEKPRLWATTDIIEDLGNRVTVYVYANKGERGSVRAMLKNRIKSVKLAG